MCSRKKEFCLFIVLITLTFPVNSLIRGYIVDINNHPIEFATIKLLDNDSIFITGTASDKAGEFIISVKSPGEYMFAASCIGLEDFYLPLKYIGYTKDIRNIVLDGSSTSLDEIVITSRHMVSKEDKILIFPSDLNKKHANNGYRLLSTLMLPKINVDLVNNSVTTIGGNVTLCINGKEVTHEDIHALRPNDIIRLEYHELPSSQFAGKVAVIDFITRQYSQGGYLIFNGDQRLTYGNGDYLSMVRLNKNRSEWSIGYKFNYLCDKKKYRDLEEVFLFHDQTLTREEHSNPYHQKKNEHLVFVNYNFRKDSTNPNFRGGYSSQNTPEYRIVSSQTYKGENNLNYQLKEKISEKYEQPYFNLYYTKKLRNKQYLYLMLNGHNSKNSYNRFFSQANEEQTQNINSHVNEDLYKIDGGGDYRRRLSENKRLSLKLYHFQNYTKSTYTGNFESTEKLINGETMSWIEYFQKWENTTLIAALGGTYTFYFQNDTPLQDYFSFRLQLTLQHSFNKDNIIQWRSYIGNSFPRLSTLSDVEQQIDFLLIRRGNPILKSMKVYTNMLYFWHNINSIRFDYYLQHKLYNPNQKENIKIENNSFIKSFESAGTFQNINSGLTTTAIFFNGDLKLNLDMGFNKSIVTNSIINYLTCWFLNTDISYIHKQFMTNLYFKSPYRQLYNSSEIFRRSAIYGMAITYNHGGFSISIGTQNPFSKYTTIRENHFNVYSSKRQYHNSQSDRLVYLKLSYNFSFGRKYNYSDIDININTNSAILKGEKA